NLLTAIIQALLVSGIVKYLGLAGAFLALPIVALGAYGSVLVGATFLVVRLAKTAENATDYSIMNVARQMLWLPTSREEKYKGKQAADTFIVRFGDVMSAILVWIGTAKLSLGQRGFATANLLLIAVWIALGYVLLREYRRRTAAPAAA